MPNMLKIDYEAISKELAIWRSTHRAMRPFIIISQETLKILEADNIEFDYITNVTGKALCQLMGVDVAICNSLRLGEFKVR